jgi:hypothetical protein
VIASSFSARAFDLLSVWSDKGFIMSVSGKAKAFAPPAIFPPSRSSTYEAMRSAHEDDFPLSAEVLVAPVVDSLMGRFDGVMREVTDGDTVRDLIIET